MPKFSYEAVDPNGAVVTGVVDAASAVRARNDLMGRALQVIEVKERKSLAQFEITAKKLKPAELMNFSRQLAAFLRAGIPIIDALEALNSESVSPLLSKVLNDVCDGLRSGSTFTDAIAHHRQMFPNYYIGILRSAELSGNLDIVLEQLAGYIERDLEAKRAVKSALTYPAVIFAMSIVTVIVLVSYVLPRFETFFDSFDAELPLPTRIMLGFSRFLGEWWTVIVAVMVFSAIAILVTLRTERGKFLRDKLLLRVPVLGDVVRYAVVERFCRILGAMLSAGVPVPEAMAAATEATNNREYQQGLAVAREAIMRGEGMAGPVSETGLFPGAANQMLRVGEESGTLDQQLEVTAKFYESELGYKLKRLTSLFEPIVITVMGLIVGFVAIALVSAMYGIFNQVELK